MPQVGIPYRVYYTSKNHTPGLTDVLLSVLRPDTIKEGPLVMSELNSDDPEIEGIYYRDIVPPIEGEYLLIANCASLPKKHERSIVFEFSQSQRPVISFD